MRRLVSVLLLSLGLCMAASAQIRTSQDIANGNFVIGLDNYLRFTASTNGTAGFDFSTHGHTFKAIVKDQQIEVSETGSTPVAVYADGRLKLAPARPNLTIPALGVAENGRRLDSNEIVVGIHDFTGDREPELVVALRDKSGKGANGNGLVVYVLEFKDGKWRSCGEIAAFDANIEECRIFRQVITIDTVNNFYTWTYRGSSFGFRSKDGSNDPATAL